MNVTAEAIKSITDYVVKIEAKTADEKQDALDVLQFVIESLESQLKKQHPDINKLSLKFLNA